MARATATDSNALRRPSRLARAGVLALTCLAGAACVDSSALGSGTRALAAPGRPRATAHPATGIVWEALDVVVESPPRAPTLPLADVDVTRLDGATTRWSSLATEAKELVRKQGWAIVAATGPRRMGVVYTDLTAAKMPLVLTLDALFELVHLSTRAMLAEVDMLDIVPATLQLLIRMETELTRESAGAASDLGVPYTLARGIVAVARTLLDARYVAPPELAGRVRREVALARAHAGLEVSPLLGVSVDYSALAPRAGTIGLDGESAATALAWLAAAPLVLLGRGEAGGSSADISLTRGHTRAALLLGRRVRSDIDPRAAASWERIEALARTLIGPTDELTLRELDAAATKNGIDVRDGRTVVDVTKIDRLRHALVSGRTLRIPDENGLTVRVLPARLAPDAIALASRVSPAVPGRSMPVAADMIVWLRSAEARNQHASFYVSALDAISTALGPSLADVTLPATQSASWRTRTETVALAAWATLRHDFASTCSLRLDHTPTPAARASTKVEAVTPLVMVEPHPEAIGRLASLVRQAMRGLDAISGLRADGPARAVLAHVDQLLTVAFEVSLLAANDEPPTADQTAVLRTIPAWIATLEEALSSSAPRAVDVHTDLGTRAVLEETTGYPATLYLVLREPGSGRLVLTAGAAIPHEELTHAMADRLTDAAWRARLDRKSAPVSLEETPGSSRR